MLKNIPVILVLLILTAGCSLSEKDGEIIAQVDKETLTLAEFKANFPEAQWQSLTPDQKKEYVQQWVNLVLLAKEAEKLGLADDKVIKNRMKYAGQKVLANALIASRLAAQQVSEEEMFNYYRIHQGEFSKPVMNYKVQRILLTDAAMLAKVRLEIQNGMKFEDAAKIYSLEEFGRTGGYMGTVTPDGADSTIWQALNKIKLYEITSLQTADGYYLLRSYMEEQGSGASGFEGQKDIIQKRILEERRRQVYDELLQELKSKSDVYLMI